METWLGELRSPPGEGPWRGANRQLGAGFRLLRRDRTVLALTLLGALALTAVWVGFYLLERDTGTLGREADRVFRHLLFGASWFGVWLLLSLAVACAADTAIDGLGADVGLLASEVRRRLPALLCLWLVSLCAWYGLNLALEYLFSHWATALGCSLVWAMATFFAVPAIAIEEGRPLDSLRTTLRLLRARWGRALIGLLLLGCFLLLAAIPSGIVLRDAANHYPGDSGAGLWASIGGIALFYLAYSVMTAAHEGFALILARDALGDLPGSAAAPRPRRRGWVIAKRIALGVLVLLILLVALGAILRHRRHSDQPSRPTPVESPHTTES